MDFPSRRLLQASKLRPPPVDGLVPRPRVQAALGEALEGHPVVIVVAAAGSGKTTAVAQHVATVGRPVAWLTLDEADSRPGRLATYLASAVGAVDESARATSIAMLEDGLPPVDCAAHLAEAIPDGSLVVLDDVHHLADDSTREVLRAFIGGLNDAARVVLLARRLPAVGLERSALSLRVAGVFDHDLAFTEEEAAALLQARSVDADVRRLHQATGGWAAGLVFESLSLMDRPVLPPGEDALFAYLGSEIYDRLPDGIRNVVLKSAVMDSVNADRLERLLGEDGGEVLFGQLCREHLPATVVDGMLRYHPRFREFLVHRLRVELPFEVAPLIARFGEILRAEGYAEEATDAFIAAGRLEEAEDVAVAAVGALLRRGDWDKVISWTDALGDDAAQRRGTLRGAQLRALLLGRRGPELERLVHSMLASGEIARLGSEAPDTVGWAVWALHGSGEWAKLLPLLPEDSGRRVEVVRYLFKTSASPISAPELPKGVLDAPQPLHVALQSAFYYQGRFDEVDRLAAAAGQRGPVTQALGQIFRIASLRERGDLAGARAALDDVAARVRASRFLEFWHQVESELVFEEGSHEEGVLLIREARRLSRDHGYRIGASAIFPAVEGKHLVRLGRLDEAETLLRDASVWCAERGLLGFGEWADTWLGAAMLLMESDPEQARRQLLGAVKGMDRAARRLHLAAGAVFLAEAEWRLGDEDAHDAACDLALLTAEAQGTLAPLRRALELFPAVLVRRVDAEAASGTVWSRLLQRATSASASVPEHPRVLIRTFGELGMEVEGVPTRAGLGKAVEVAKLIAASGRRGVSREHLMQQVFESSTDARTYLRQALHRLRRTVPGDVSLVEEGGRLVWEPEHAVVNEDQVLEALNTRARLAMGPERLRLLSEAVAISERGPYLPGMGGERIDARRRYLSELDAEIRRDLAASLLAGGRADEAGRLLEVALLEDPWHEATWQNLMRAEAVLGGPEAVAGVLHRCVTVLAEAGLDPCENTLRLAESLRRSAQRTRSGAPAGE